MITREELAEMFGATLPIEAAMILTSQEMLSEDEVRAELRAMVPKKVKSKLYAHVLLDRSGSMESCRDTTIDAFNEYVNGLAKNPDLDTRVSLTTFDTESIDLVFDCVPAGDFKKLTRATYVPRGGTPLNDAIGKTVVKIDAVTLRDEERVALVILTDGQENSSREYVKDAVKALIEGRQKDKNWLVLFLGANIDAFAEGVGRGATAGNSLQFTNHNVGSAMNAANLATARYAVSGQSVHANFTQQERMAAVDPFQQALDENAKKQREKKGAGTGA
jgi:hypothetical protein